MEQKIIQTLEYHEVKRIYDYLNISSKKHDITVPKIKIILDSMNEFSHPVCQIIVEEKS
jgi:hypothetical protein